MAESQGSSTRPSTKRRLTSREKRKRDAEWIDRPLPKVELLAQRFTQGVDLWTGLPLEGEAAEDWLHLSFNMQEPSDYDPWTLIPSEDEQEEEAA